MPKYLNECSLDKTAGKTMALPFKKHKKTYFLFASVYVFKIQDCFPYYSRQKFPNRLTFKSLAAGSRLTFYENNSGDQLFLFSGTAGGQFSENGKQRWTSEQESSPQTDSLESQPELVLRLTHFSFFLSNSS